MMFRLLLYAGQGVGFGGENGEVLQPVDMKLHFPSRVGLRVFPVCFLLFHSESQIAI